MSVFDGGEFGSGFLSGLVSSVIASGVKVYGDIASMFEFIGGSGISDNTIMAIQIASGGLSGGISSTIAGGNFWQGVKQGVITSGLNHAMHSGVKLLKEKSWIRQQLKDAGYSNSRIKESLTGLDKTGRESMILELMGRVKSLRLLEGLYNEGIFSIDVSISDDPYGDGAAARTSINDISNPNGSTSSVSFYNAAFKSLYGLTRAIHNEGIHVQHNNSGLTYQWYASAWRKTADTTKAFQYAYYISDYYSSISTAYGVSTQLEVLHYNNLANKALNSANQICSTCLR